MSILINMEMPKDKTVAVVIHPDGTAYTAEMFAGVCTKYLADCTAVLVPPHGRLIDKDALEADISASVVFSGRDGNAEIVGAKKIINRLHVAPTIIPAEEVTKA